MRKFFRAATEATLLCGAIVAGSAFVGWGIKHHSPLFPIALAVGFLWLIVFAQAYVG